VREAIDHGVSLAQSRVATAINKHLDKNPIVAIFAAKQSLEKGGLGWADRQEHIVSGSVEHQFPALDAWRKAISEQRDSKADKVIDADYSVLE